MGGAEVTELCQEVLFNVTGQSVFLDAPEGRPSSVTSVTVLRSEIDDDGQTETALGAAAVDSVNTTLTAAAGAAQTDATALALTSGAGVVAGRSYLVTAGGGDREWVELAAIAGTAASSRAPMLNDYGIGATFQGTRITAPLLDTFIQDRTKVSGELGLVWWKDPPGDQDGEPWFRVVWLYVVAGVTCRRETRLDVVRYTAMHSVTPLDVERCFPGWLERVPVDHRRGQGQDLIEDAFRAVRMDLLADGHAARWLRRGDVVAELVVYRAKHKAALLAFYNGGAGKDVHEEAEEQYQRRYAQLIREPEARIGTSAGGGIIGGRDVARVLRR